MVAVPMKRLGQALAELKPQDRALLDLSVRRALPDAEIAGVLKVPAEEVAQRRDEVLSEPERKLELESREAKNELRATCWTCRRSSGTRAARSRPPARTAGCCRGSPCRADGRRR